MNGAIGGQGELKKKRFWLGKWYKPWTWFKYTEYFEVGDFKLIEFSMVQNPVNPMCIINREGK